jgi:hypothetical protein
MDTSGVEVILTETVKNTIKERLDKARTIISSEKATLLTDAYAELIRRTGQI